MILEKPYTFLLTTIPVEFSLMNWKYPVFIIIAINNNNLFTKLLLLFNVGLQNCLSSADNYRKKMINCNPL